MLITLVELPEFIRNSKKLLSQKEKDNLFFHLSINPKAGNILQGTNGVRKLRWARNSKGKSGGVRVIYFYFDEQTPLFLLTIFGKGKKANLSKNERNELAKLVNVLIQQYRKKGKNK